jgi:hypothetical protein
MAGSIRIFRFFSIAALALMLSVAGCHSAYVQIAVVNSGSTELHNVEVDYPSASFGISSLAPGQTFHYRFQLRDTGRMKVQFLDSAEKPHSGTGPYAAEGQQGRLTITLDGSGKNLWSADLRPTVPTPRGE